LEKEVISQKQAIIIMSTFIIGSTAILGIGTHAKQDIWIATIIAMVMTSLIFAVYGRISSLFPGKSIYEILDLLFGKVFGKVFLLFFVFYSFTLGALVIRDFGEFVKIASLPETPLCIFAFFAVVLIIWAVREGIELLGRFLAIFFPIYVFMISIVTLLSIPLFDFSNLKPVLYDGLNPVLTDSFGIFTFPFAEVVVFLCLMGSLRKNSSVYKVYYNSLLISGTLLIIIALRSILVLGMPGRLIQNFPPYASTRIIRIGAFLQRIEASIAIIFMLSGFTKTTVCLYATTKGIAHLFNIKGYRKLAAPLGILTALYSLIMYEDAAKMFEWTSKIYPYYAIPHQIIFPTLAWIVAEVKTRTSKKNNAIKAEETDSTALPESHN
jgi:spore germination protein KB